MTDYQTIKQTVSMAQVLERYGLTAKLRRCGDGWRGPCPIHQGRNPTQFHVSDERNCWVCFGDCQSGGSVLDFVSRMERVNLTTAAQLLQQWFHLSPQTAAVASRGPRVRMASEGGVPRHAEYNSPLRFELRELDTTHPYLAMRDLLPETITTFGFGYCANGVMAGRIAIPIHNIGGELVAYAGRWPGTPPKDEPKYLFPRGFRKSLELYNYHRAIIAEPQTALVVVEGFFDCLKVWQAGFERVVAIMGSSLSDAQTNLIVSAVGSGGEVLVMFDEDGAGRAGREKAAARLAHSVDVRVIELEAEGIQPDHLPAAEIMGLLADAGRAVRA